MARVQGEYCLMFICNVNYIASSKNAFEKMKTENLRMELPENNEIFIDIDTQEQYDLFQSLFNILVYHLRVSKIETESKSGKPHYHIRIKFEFDLTIWQRMAFQAALGSDLKRELLGCLMVLNNDPYPTFLLEKEQGIDS